MCYVRGSLSEVPVVMSSLPEMDISQNYDSTSYFSTCSFSEISSKEELDLELELEERREPKDSTLHCNPVVCEQKDDQLSDGQEECCDIFYEDCNQYAENNCSPLVFPHLNIWNKD